MKRHGRGQVAATALAVTVGVLVAAPTAMAVIPEGNLLLNADGETGIAARDETSSYCPAGWTCEGKPTLVRYGTTTFPSLAESARIGGGANFFAGGPDVIEPRLLQKVDLSVAASEIGAQQVQATISGCLGGWQDQDDVAKLHVVWLAPNQAVGGPDVDGPTAAQRGNETKLAPASKVVVVPPGTRSVQFEIDFTGGAGSYNDGYADNVSFALAPFPGLPAPAASCSAPPGDGGGGTPGQPGPPVGGGEPGGTSGGGAGAGAGGTGVLAFARRAVVSNGTARVPVRCQTDRVSRCRGTLSLRLVRARSAGAQSARRGFVRYSVPAFSTRTVKVRLRRADARTVAGLPGRRLAKRRLRLRTSTTVGTATLKQTVLLRIKRR